MAAIVVKNGKKSIQTDAQDFLIGTGPSCLVVLNDPIAAALHARITRRAGTFLVEDAGSASGTWKNGESVAQAEVLADRDEIVVGCTRIEVAITRGDGGLQLVLDVREKSFHFELSTRRKITSGGEERTVVSGDAERWVRDEVAFGRFRALFGLNLVALAAGLAAFVLVAFATVRARYLQPGPLHTAHARLFEVHAADVSARFAQAAGIANAQACGACHDRFGGTPASKCGACHADTLSARHPFEADPSEALPAGTKPLDAGWCSQCHVDHQGGSSLKHAFDAGGTALAAHCQECHTPGVPAIGRRKLQTVPVREYALTYEAFSHASHAQVTCAVCHATRLPDSERAVTDRDFARVPFESCMQCHSRTESITADSKWARKPEVAALGGAVEPEHQVQLRWHGSHAENGAQCLACHEKLYDAKLRETNTRAAEVTFSLKTRSHKELFAAHELGLKDGNGRMRACVECHVDGQPLQAGTERTQPFSHALHMTAVGPGAVAADLVRTSAECAACHSDLVNSKALAGRSGEAGDDLANIPAYLGNDTHTCAQCHREGVGEALAVHAVEAPSSAPPRRRTDFPHAAHMDFAQASLNRGCYSCHEFDASDDVAKSRPVTLDAQRMSKCLPCHADHRAIGGDGCELCHPTRDGRADDVYSGPLGDEPIASLAARRKKSRADTSGFSHWSSGHKGSMEANACEVCHPGTNRARALGEVVMPSEADASCAHCHVEEQKQFHWRGEPTGKAQPAQPR